MKNSGGELLVDTEQLTSFGNELVNTEFGEQLTSLKGSMSAIQNSWLDAQGSNFSQTFSSFINDSQKITTEIEALGKFAVEISQKYEEILNTKLEQMKNF